jgi:hypothetical protein
MKEMADPEILSVRSAVTARESSQGGHSNGWEDTDSRRQLSIGREFSYLPE